MQCAPCNAMAASNRRVVLLVAEAVTLAHFARIAALAKALDPARYVVVVAADPRYAALDTEPSYTFQAIRSIPSAQFAQALEQGKPVYDFATLARYAEDDLRLIKAVKPDLIVGDFRLSLAASAPVAGTPYACVVNAYWSPYAAVEYPVPELPITRLLGAGAAQTLFNAVRPLAFAVHARPLNRLRRRYGLSSLGHDLRVSYTWGNHTLYADVPELVPTRRLPANHRHIGPPLWSVGTPLPDWWQRLPEDKPVVLVTVGTSGQADLLPMTLSVLSGLPVTAIAATAGTVDPSTVPENAFVSDFLPLEIAVKRSTLVICNGGSLTTYRALASRVPVIGICSNMDQMLNMRAVERIGGGVFLRAARVGPAELERAVRAILRGGSYAEAAAHVATSLAQVDASERFRAFVSEVVG